MSNHTTGLPVVLVDDEVEIRSAWAETLALEAYKPLAFGNGQEALRALCVDWPGAVVTDLRMPVMDGMNFLEAVRRIDPDIPVIIVTGHGDIPMAVRAVRSGAYDFIEKPADPETMLAAVARAVRMRSLVIENRRLSRKGSGGYEIEKHLVGNSEAMRRLRQRVAAVAAADVNTVIYGETGSGKELVARALHSLGPRRNGSFVALNCGALPDTLIASELFGHEAGAFTGADRRRIGRLEQASGGTLFLDEIESMPIAHQTQLLRALQSQVIERLGGKAEIPINVRVVAASKADLEEASSEGRFRADLYYRIAVAMVSIPPLRHRVEDIPLLFMNYTEKCAKSRGIKLATPDTAFFEELCTRPWKGNVRELVNFAERHALGIDADLGEMAIAGEERRSLPDQVDAFEKRILINALRATGGRAQQTADLLRIPRKRLYLRLQRHGLDREGFCGEAESLVTRDEDDLGQ
ncbi:sigma-54-dependent Fis family transcriptional regulator [Mesorhizobium plurifarium]|uniref:sigma-54-dependent transcriptional regulator n=1 Tax=Sinorhizobium arboris TaxID=76745 RepID=UPI0003F9A195|nr:sigma-54 dependent transcriptional regulator [Sinorhizobium arboris]PST18396.1 sigma-54-dependent Fis family transcriptional regulator [Mesorhizobium plurifarium]PST18833.1 sigma-54-dependent Fis family transcriptional regulator [Mesorhizobium plurifarium]